jgi:uncharacterized membrane protein HdeD (DUF308 family)
VSSFFSNRVAADRGAEFGRRWWIFLITAAFWLVIAWVVLRFDMRTVRAIAWLAGIIILMAAVAEIFNMVAAPGWKWLHGLLAVLFLVTGIICLIDPGNAFVWLSAFIGWYLLFKGIADIVIAFATKADNDAWWLALIVGIVEVMLGFWAAGHFQRSAYLLVVFVAVIALTRAIGDIVTAFGLRSLHDSGRMPGPMTSTPSTPAVA